MTGGWWHPRQAIEQAHAYGLRTIFNQYAHSIVKTKVTYLSESIAVVHTKMKLTGQTPIPEIPSPGPRQTIFIVVVHRQDEEWSGTTAQNTNVVSNREPHVQNEAGQLIPADYRHHRRRT